MQQEVHFWGCQFENRKMLKFKNAIVLFSLLLIHGVTAAQTKFTVSGEVRSATTGETLIGAIVVGVAQTPFVAVTNEYGHYSLTLPKGEYSLICSIIGYQSDTVRVDLRTSSQMVKFELEQKDTQIQDLIVSATRNSNRITQPQAGVDKISTEQIAKIPVIFGEKDLLKTIQLLPGVKTAGEGSAGFTVRGGELDQNLILLDDAPVYNASHLFGFFSTFNSAAIKDVTVYKGNYPAHYGGRISSVVDVTMNNGNNKRYSVNGGIGLISSNVSVEGPIQKDKSSFLVSARRTYADMFLKVDSKFSDNQLYFYDLNAKANFEINSKNRLFFSGYIGRDVLGLKDKVGLDWGNKTASLRWNSSISPRLFTNTTFVFSDYNYNVKVDVGQTDFKIYSQIEDINLKHEFRLNLNSNNNLRFGVNSVYRTITPTHFIDTEIINPGKTSSRHTWENIGFVSYNSRITDWFNLEVGARFNSSTLVGGGVYGVYEQGVYKNSIDLGKNTFGKTYNNIEPRISTSFVVNETTSIKAAYGKNSQRLHLLTNNSASNPTDQWMGASYTVRPTLSDQYSVGLFKNLFDQQLELSAEAYFKKMTNEVDFRDGADIFTNTEGDVESQLLFGRGRAYGVEILLKKQRGRLTGWVGYTLSRAERQITGINQDRWYPTNQDRTHDISVVGMYDLNKRWQVSATWVYHTGSAVTYPSGKYTVDGQTIMLYSERNGYRAPDYHRLDIGATYTKPHRGRFESSWNFSIYNAYGRQNPYLTYFEDDPNNSLRTRAMQISLFRWVPSFTYNFKF